MPSKIIFSVLKHKQPTSTTERDTFILRTDNWDDYGYRVQFHLSYLDEYGAEIRIGSVKILQKIDSNERSLEIAELTKLPMSFSNLGDEFISLGQEERYYKKLYDLFGKSAKKILDSLCDIAVSPAAATEYEPTTAFRNALMRENGAQRARRFGAALANGQRSNEEASFTYIGYIEGAAEDTEVYFDFDSKDPIPGRIVGIIGRNAVGKTRFLASLSADLAQISRTSAEKLTEREERFPDDRPLFTRVIAISYSAFDRFKRPAADRSSSYVYCGIRNEKGGLSRISLMNSYKNNLKRISDLGVEDYWIEYMQEILGDLSEELVFSLKAEIHNLEEPDKTLSHLSSGQSILAHFVTALLAWIQPNSLVIFDEPETHLHPNAVANLFIVLSKILNKFDSFSVVATHSPVVIQEIPAKRVLVFQREENITTANPLQLESFGESVTELTKHVFETIEIENVYRKTLRKLALKESAEEVLSRFDNGLSLSAEAYLLAQYSKKKSKNK